MDLFMPAERVLYDRAYYLSDEAVDDYNEYIAKTSILSPAISSIRFPWTISQGLCAATC